LRLRNEGEKRQRKHTKVQNKEERKKGIKGINEGLVGIQWISRNATIIKVTFYSSFKSFSYEFCRLKSKTRENIIKFLLKMFSCLITFYVRMRMCDMYVCTYEGDVDDATTVVPHLYKERRGNGGHW